MKFIELNKENLEKVLAQLSEEYNCIYTDNDKVALKYLNYFLSLPDDFEHKQIIRYMSGMADKKKAAKMDKRALKYKINGCYEYFYYHDDRNNKNYFTMDEVYQAVPDCYIVQDGTKETITHYTYNEELDCLLAYVYHVEKKDGERVYSRTKQVSIITRNKLCVRLSDGYLKVSDDGFSVSDNNVENELVHHGLSKAFIKMFKQPIVNIGANNFVTVDTFDALLSFLSYRAKLDVKAGPKQKKIEELTSIALPELSFEIPGDYKGKTISTPYEKTCVQKVKEGCCVVRWCLKGVHTDVECDGLRIYVEGKNIYPCKLNNNNQFVRTTISNIKPENFLSCEMEDIDKEYLKGTALEYFGEIINDVPKEYRSLLLIIFLKEPHVEQFFKLGLQDLIYEATRQKEYDVLSFVQKCLGINAADMDKNAFKSIGINKHQFEYYKKMLNSISADYTIKDNTIHFISYIKRAVGVDKLPTLSDAQFEKIAVALFKTIKDLRNSYYSRGADLYTTNLQEIRKKIEHTNNKNLIKRFFEVLPDICTIPSSDISLYRDYINMVATMDDFKNFKIGISNTNEIKEMHDAATSVYNLKKQEYKTKQFQAQLEKVEKLEYQNKEDEFIVVIPKVPGDLAKEGLELHHCVKSYIQKVIDGDTNIVFIRKKSNPDKPFFTVEVSNTKTVEQVHGFGNRNSNTEPGLDDFVKRWAKNKHLKIANINKVR